MPRAPLTFSQKVGNVLGLAGVVFGVALVAIALAMLAADVVHEVDATGEANLGVTVPFDVAYREAFVPLLAFASLAGTAGSLVLFVARKRSPRIRAHGKRAAGGFCAGAGLVDLAYLADVGGGLTAGYAQRAMAIDPLYVAAGVLLAGAAWRLRSYVLPLPPGDPDFDG